MDILYYNGRIDTRDRLGTVAEAVGVKDGRIAFVGTTEAGRALGCAQEVDLEGAYVLPAFQDSHLHLLNYAFIESSFKMFDFHSIAEIKAAAKAFAAERGIGGGKWLFGRGWNHETFTDERRFLTRSDLDEISSEFPVFFIRACGHIAAGNSRAVEEIMKLDRAGEFRRFIDVEQGVFREAGVKLCYDAMNPPTQQEVEDMICLAARDMNAVGIAGVQTDDFLSLPGRDYQTIINAYNNLQCKGKLNLRVYEQTVFPCLADMEGYLALGYRTGMGGPCFKLGPIKLLQDGSLGAHTALLRAPYSDGSGERGIQVHQTEDFYKLVRRAHESGMQIAVHAIGDGAAEMVVDAFEQAQAACPRPDARHGVVHAQITDRALLERIARDGVLTYIQPVFIEDDMDIVERCVGVERMNSSYAWKTMLDLGIHASGGSDAPVVRFHTLENIQMAVTRRKRSGFPEGGWLPQERLTVDQAVDLFTKAPAYACFEENLRGSLEPGYYADMVVLGQDIHQTAENRIQDIPVLRTILAGRTVYQA